MLFFAIALQMMPGMVMPPSTAKPVIAKPLPKDQMPAPMDMVMNHEKITVKELATSTIAYCERTKQTYCVNGVSELSGGTVVNVCKIAGKWRINDCNYRRRR